MSIEPSNKAIEALSTEVGEGQWAKPFRQRLCDGLKAAYDIDFAALQQENGRLKKDVELLGASYVDGNLVVHMNKYHASHREPDYETLRTELQQANEDKNDALARMVKTERELQQAREEIGRWNDTLTDNNRFIDKLQQQLAQSQGEEKRYKYLHELETNRAVKAERENFLANAEIVGLQARLDEAISEKDGAYLERNRLVALLARIFPSGLARTAIEGWSDDWHGCVYIDLPYTGQASWHYHDSQAYLFEGLPPYKYTWDGHTTEEKYKRVSEAAAFLAAQRNERTNDNAKTR